MQNFTMGYLIIVIIPWQVEHKITVPLEYIFHMAFHCPPNHPWYTRC